MTLTEQSPKKIYLWSTEVKAVYKWTVKVRPVQELPFTPWANTVAYFPLKNDILDHAGNLTLTHGTMTQSTIGYSVTGWAKVTTNGAVYFMCWWCNVQSVNGGMANICTCDNPEMGYYYAHASNSSLVQVCYVAGGGLFPATSTSVSIWTNARHHYAISYENWKSCVYVDGVKRVEYNWVWDNYANMAYLFSSRPRDGATPNSWTGIAIISDYILESVWWTAQEVLDYYNQTKSIYWL